MAKDAKPKTRRAKKTTGARLSKATASAEFDNAATPTIALATALTPPAQAGPSTREYMQLRTAQKTIDTPVAPRGRPSRKKP